MKKESLYQFTGQNGDFTSHHPDQINTLYFPLANELGLLSAITPRFHGDIKLDQHSFLMPPVSIEDLHLMRSGRNFWVSLFPNATSTKPQTCWAINGLSPHQKTSQEREPVQLKAGLLWQQVTRNSKLLGLEVEVLNFVPVEAGTFEIMRVVIKNTGKKKKWIQGTSAIPLFSRSADNLRDHRHVTSLLNRIEKTKFGLKVAPTMVFNESGHHMNSSSYYIVGSQGSGKLPVGVFPTVDSFIGEGGDLDQPQSILQGTKPHTNITAADQGKENMGALQFKRVELAPGASTEIVLFLGIGSLETQPDKFIEKFGKRKDLQALLKKTQEFWRTKTDQIDFQTGDKEFNQWIRWVNAQPTFRKIFGNSFLPDFDYGRGGRGWRDLWQDCLALLLANPSEVKPMILKNYGGVRMDGSNATLIGRKRVSKTSPQTNGSHKTSEGFYWEPEFIADRNNITRTWMDHGTWPYLTTELYINQTGDWDILKKKTTYFRDAQLNRGRKLDLDWIQNQSSDGQSQKYKTKSGIPYEGSVLEHILVQTLTQFFNVGEHNIIRLEDADWNDGLDMARDRGESVAFTSLYAGNLEALAELLSNAGKRAGWTHVEVAEELILLLDRVGQKIDYNSIQAKTARLKEYFDTIQHGAKGESASVPITTLVQDLKAKAQWIKDHLNKQEWVEAEGFRWMNGYYDNVGKKVEGKGANGSIRMTLTGQVYPLSAGVVADDQVKNIVQAVNEHLWDHTLGGIRLNTDFGAIQPHLGRGFSFAYGEKENGAIFSHMVVMYAHALYRRGLVEEGFRALQSLYLLAKNSKQSRIFPGIPEYFNNEGRGRYHYLTGSASWYILTLLTEVFGVRGNFGDLMLAPKLVPDQFDKAGRAVVQCHFAGTRLKIIYENPKRIPHSDMKIENVTANGADVPFSRVSDSKIVIQRELLATNTDWTLNLKLGGK